MGLDLLVKAPAKRLRILWADDDPKYLRGEHRHLRRKGHSVLSTVNFESTAHTLATQEFDLLFLDQQMPREGRKAIDAGTSLMAMLRDGELGDLNRSIPFVFWTASEAWVEESGFDADEVDECLGIEEKGNYPLDALDKYVREACTRLHDADPGAVEVEAEDDRPPAGPGGSDPEEGSPPALSSVLDEVWSGVVLELGAASFHARLSEVGGSHPDHEATLPYEFIAAAEQESIVEGATFRWTMAIEERESGERVALSWVKFDEVPEISRADVEEALRLATEEQERREGEIAS